MPNAPGFAHTHKQSHIMPHIRHLRSQLVENGDKFPKKMMCQHIRGTNVIFL